MNTLNLSARSAHHLNSLYTTECIGVIALQATPTRYGVQRGLCEDR
jgi:hypothetical protein